MVFQIFLFQILEKKTVLASLDFPWEGNQLWSRYGVVGFNESSLLSFQEIDIAIRKEVEEAAQYATSDPEPPLEELCNHIFKNDPPLEVRGTHPWATLKSVS